MHALTHTLSRNCCRDELLAQRNGQLQAAQSALETERRRAAAAEQQLRQLLGQGEKVEALREHVLQLARQTRGEAAAGAKARAGAAATQSLMGEEGRENGGRVMSHSAGHGGRGMGFGGAEGGAAWPAAAQRYAALCVCFSSSVFESKLHTATYCVILYCYYPFTCSPSLPIFSAGMRTPLAPNRAVLNFNAPPSPAQPFKTLLPSRQQGGGDTPKWYRKLR